MALPMFMIRLLNPLVAAILRSPLHGLLSRETMLLTFTGRKSGRRYTTPVSYVRDDRRIRVFTTFPWWKNVKHGAGVEAVVAGATHQGTATVVDDDPARIREALEDFLKRVPRDEVYFSRDAGGEINLSADLDGTPRPVVLIEITLAS